MTVIVLCNGVEVVTLDSDQIPRIGESLTLEDPILVTYQIIGLNWRLRFPKEGQSDHRIEVLTIKISNKPQTDNPILP